MIIVAIAIICFCLGIVTAIVKKQLLFSPIEWIVISIAVMIIFSRFG